MRLSDNLVQTLIKIIALTLMMAFAALMIILIENKHIGYLTDKETYGEVYEYIDKIDINDEILDDLEGDFFD